MDLPGSEQRVDDHTRVIHGDIVEDLDHPSIRVDLDVSHVYARRRPHSNRIVEERLVQARLHSIRQDVAQMRHSCDFVESQRRNLRSRNDEAAVLV